MPHEGPPYGDDRDNDVEQEKSPEQIEAEEQHVHEILDALEGEAGVPSVAASTEGGDEANDTEKKDDTPTEHKLEGDEKEQAPAKKKRIVRGQKRNKRKKRRGVGSPYGQGGRNKKMEERRDAQQEGDGTDADGEKKKFDWNIIKESKEEDTVVEPEVEETVPPQEDEPQVEEQQPVPSPAPEPEKVQTPQEKEVENKHESWQAARETYREYWSELNQAKDEYFALLREYEHKNQELGFIKRHLSLEQGKRKEALQEKKEKYDALIDQIGRRREERKNAFVAWRDKMTEDEHAAAIAEAREPVPSERSSAERLEKYVALHETLLDKNTESEVAEIESLEAARNRSPESANRYIRWTKAKWDWYRKLPAHKRILYGAGLAGAVGFTVSVGGGIAAGLAGGGWFAARRVLGGAAGTGAALYVKRKSDETVDEFDTEGRKSIEKQWDSYSRSRKRDVQLEHGRTVKHKRMIGTIQAGAAAAAAGGGVYSAVSAIESAPDAVGTAADLAPAEAPEIPESPQLVPEDVPSDIPESIEDAIQGTPEPQVPEGPAVEELPADVPTSGPEPEIQDLMKGLVEESLEPEHLEFTGTYEAGSSIEHELQDFLEHSDWVKEQYPDLTEAERGVIAHRVRLALMDDPKAAEALEVRGGDWDKVYKGDSYSLKIDTELLEREIEAIHEGPDETLVQESKTAVETPENTADMAAKKADIAARELERIKALDEELFGREMAATHGPKSAVAPEVQPMADDVPDEEIAVNERDDSAPVEPTPDIEKLRAQQEVVESAPPASVESTDKLPLKDDLEQAQEQMEDIGVDYQGARTLPHIKQLFEQEGLFDKRLMGQKHLVQSYWGPMSHSYINDIMDGKGSLKFQIGDGDPVTMGAEPERLARSLVVQLEKVEGTEELFRTAREQNINLGELVRRIDAHQQALEDSNDMLVQAEKAVGVNPEEGLDVKPNVEQVASTKARLEDIESERPYRKPRLKRVYEETAFGRKKIYTATLDDVSRISDVVEDHVEGKYLQRYPHWRAGDASELYQQDPAFRTAVRTQTTEIAQLLRSHSHTVRDVFNSRVRMPLSSIHINWQDSMGDMTPEEVLEQLEQHKQNIKRELADHGPRSRTIAKASADWKWRRK